MEPLNLDQMLAEFTGTGIEELVTPIPISNGVTIHLSNVATESEVEAIVASEEFKGHHWMQRIKCEILSRAVSKISDHVVSSEDTVIDPQDPESTIGLRSALRQKMFTWAPEFLQVVWKIYMVHCQNVEDKLLASFPDSAVMTDYEQRFYDRTMQMMDEISRDVMAEDTPPIEE
jgi:hypothetical protein